MAAIYYRVLESETKVEITRLIESFNIVSDLSIKLLSCTHSTVPGVSTRASCSSSSSLADQGRISPKASAVPILPTNDPAGASRRCRARTQYLDPTMLVTTVPNPSSSIWNHDNACFNAVVPQMVKSIIGSVAGRPTNPRVNCIACSWDAKCLQNKVQNINRRIHKIMKLLTYRYWGGTATEVSPIGKSRTFTIWLLSSHLDNSKTSASVPKRNHAFGLLLDRKAATKYNVQHQTWINSTSHTLHVPSLGQRTQS